MGSSLSDPLKGCIIKISFPYATGLPCDAGNSLLTVLNVGKMKYCMWRSEVLCSVQEILNNTEHYSLINKVSICAYI